MPSATNPASLKSAEKFRSIASASAPCGSRAGHLGSTPGQGRGAAHLKRLPELGVDFIDTADSYGPEVSENLLREALYPYKGLVIATKGGLTRPGPDSWKPNGDPKYLVAAAHKSRARLGVETIALWQLHRIDPKVPPANNSPPSSRCWTTA